MSISGLLGYFPCLLFNFSTCNLCSQVENSSTAQVGGPHDAADVGEPVLAGSDVPLPEDGFTHEVNYLILRAAYLMLYFQALGVD